MNKNMRKEKVLSNIIKLLLVFLGGIFIVSFLVYYFTNCAPETLASYKHIDDIVITNEANEKMARIEVVDTYTKNGMKYLVFTTNVSGNEKFTLSEEEYDKYIGLGNDVVDCTIYNLKCSAPIFSYEYVSYPDNDLYYFDDVVDIVGRIEEVRIEEVRKEEEKFSSLLQSRISSLLQSRISSLFQERGQRSGCINVSHAYGMDFDYGEFRIEWVDNTEQTQMDISGEIDLCHYSFVGENNFTEDEINSIAEIMDKVNGEIANYCINAIAN